MNRHQYIPWTSKQSWFAVLVTVQSLSRVRLCATVDGSLPSSSVHGLSMERGGCHFLLQDIFPDLGSSLCLLHWQESFFFLPLSYQGSPQLSGGSVKFQLLPQQFGNTWEI